MKYLMVIFVIFCSLQYSLLSESRMFSRWEYQAEEGCTKKFPKSDAKSRQSFFSCVTEEGAKFEATERDQIAREHDRAHFPKVDDDIKHRHEQKKSGSDIDSQSNVPCTASVDQKLVTCNGTIYKRLENGAILESLHAKKTGKSRESGNTISDGENLLIDDKPATRATNIKD